MDLSGVIFAALALGWAVYLIPKALQHHEELAKTRAVSTFSGRLRVLGSGHRPATAVTTNAWTSGLTGPAAPAVDAGEPVPVPSLASTPLPTSAVTRAAARKAAQRRRRVLLLLVFALGTVSSLTAFSIAPLWAPAIPGALVLTFLVIARMSVRRQAARRTPASATSSAQTVHSELAASSVSAASAAPSTADEDTEGIDVTEIRAEAAASHASTPLLPAAVDQPVADEGSLWDPLPMTLPTYVTKPTARRTVRTIALTQTSSSGHDAADTQLAREAEAARKAQAAQKDDAGQQADARDEGPTTRVAGA